MVDFVIIEPNLLSDSPQRCYKLPFAATEALCTDIEHIKKLIFPSSQNDEEVDYRILNKLFTFLTIPGGHRLSMSTSTLNHTLGGYFNKIVSFWLIKETQKMLEFIINQRHIV